MTIVRVKPATPELRIPVLGDSRAVPVDGITVDDEAPYWRALIAEKSLVPAESPAETETGKGRKQKD
jgi:hypothetical protein